MKNKIFALLCFILALLLAFSALISCSCQDENTENSTPQSQNNTSTSTQGSVNSGTNEDHLVDDKNHKHYWYNVTVDKSSSATSTATLKGKCYTCGDFLQKDVITTVTFDEWKNALSFEGLRSFTQIQGSTYTDYDENGAMSWKIEDNIYTDSYFLNSDTKNSSVIANNFLSYTISSSFNSFKYNQETRTYIQKSGDIVTELGFADGKLLSYCVSDSKNEHKSVSIFINYDSVKVEAPSYIYDYYKTLISTDALFVGLQSRSQAEKLHTLLSSMSFDEKWEMSHLKNGVLSVYFYVNSTEKDPIFNESYDSVSIVSSNGKITSVHIGNNVIEMAN